MKRTRELEETVKEIVNEVKSTDTEGRPLYPELITDPLVLGLIGAPDALLEALKERPLIILNLLQTNKALELFWNRFEGLWILLSDSLVERVWRMKDSGDVYPFFVIANQRIDERIASMFRREARPKRPSLFLNAYMYEQNKLLYPNTVLGRQPDTPPWSFSLIYYDSITKLLIDIFQHALSLGAFFPQPIHVKDSLSRYLHDISSTAEDSEYQKFRHNQGPFFYLVALEDAFIVHTREAKILMNNLSRVLFIVNYLSKRYEGYSYAPLVTEQVEITHTNEVGETSVIIEPLRVAKSLKDLLDSLAKLNTLLDRHFKGVKPIVEEPMVPVSIDAKFALPYRDLLYHREHGLFNTSEKQKTFFLSLLKELGEITSKEEVIFKFGKHAVTEPLACIVCQTETFMVDPVYHKQPFCQMSCWKQYRGLS